jgi:hypothetical protein
VIQKRSTYKRTGTAIQVASRYVPFSAHYVTPTGPITTFQQDDGNVQTSNTESSTRAYTHTHTHTHTRVFMYTRTCTRERKQSLQFREKCVDFERKRSDAPTITEVAERVSATTFYFVKRSPSSRPYNFVTLMRAQQMINGLRTALAYRDDCYNGARWQLLDRRVRLRNAFAVAPEN